MGEIRQSGHYLGKSWHDPKVELEQSGQSGHYLGQSWHDPRVELDQIGQSGHYLGKVGTIQGWNWTKLGKVVTIWARWALSKGGQGVESGQSV